MKRTPSMLLLLGTASVNAHAADNILHDMAIQFLTDEFVPTLLALAVAALREPMTWGVIGAAVLPAVLCRRRVSRPLSRSPNAPRADSD